MIELQHTSLLAMGGQAQGQGGLLLILPYLLIFVIFWFLVLLPMKRRQSKVQDFQNSLKVGDKVVTTGGIYGLVTRVNDKSVQLQIADKVRIEIARAAIGGYQGEEPLVAPNGNT